MKKQKTRENEIDSLEQDVSRGGTGLKSLVKLLDIGTNGKSEFERNSARHSLRRSFTNMFDKGELTQGSSEAELTAFNWLKAQYIEYIDSLIAWSWDQSSSPTDRVAAFRTLILFFEKEKTTKTEILGLNILTNFLTLAAEQQSLQQNDVVLRVLKEEYLDPYLDMKYFYFRSLKSVFHRNIDTLNKNSGLYLLTLTQLTDDCTENKIEKLKKSVSVKKAYENAWLKYLGNCGNNLNLIRSILIQLPAVLQNFVEPWLLSDFLTSTFAFEQDDEIPLLSLSSLFILIRDYGFDYPSFYSRMYELVKPSLFHIDRRESFCALLEASLRSSHLPAYLVASFCKKLARIALLSSSPSAALFSLALIYNVLRRNPNCLFLVHRITETKKQPEEEEAARVAEIKEASKRMALGLSASSDKTSNDPFLFDEKDLNKTNAMETSLWEVESLKSHYCPSVSSLAKSIFAHDLEKDRVTKPELPIKDFIVSYHDLYLQEGRLKRVDSEGTKKIKVETPLNSKKPNPELFKDFIIF